MPSSYVSSHFHVVFSTKNRKRNGDVSTVTIAVWTGSLAAFATFFYTLSVASFSVKKFAYRGLPLHGNATLWKDIVVR
jgi:hypothetical protein